MKTSLSKFWKEATGTNRHLTTIRERLTLWAVPFNAEAESRHAAVDARYIPRARKAYKAEQRLKQAKRDKREGARIRAHARMMDEVADGAPVPPRLDAVYAAMTRTPESAARDAAARIAPLHALERRLAMLEAAQLGVASQLKQLVAAQAHLTEQVGQIHMGIWPHISDALADEQRAQQLQRETQNAQREEATAS